MGAKKQITVDVAGQKFTLKTDADEAYVKELAAYVNGRIGEARAGGRTFSTQSLAILAAMNIADDLFRARRETAELKGKVRARSRAILELLRKG